VLNNFLRRVPKTGGFIKKAIFEFAQLALAVSFARRPETLCRYESAYSAPRFDHTRSLKFRVYLSHCVGVDPQVYGHLPDCGQLIACAQLARSYGESYRPLKLMIERRRVSCVYVKSYTHLFLLY
jgi:hypothetical protein